MSFLRTTHFSFFKEKMYMWSLLAIQPISVQNQIRGLIHSQMKSGEIFSWGDWTRLFMTLPDYSKYVHLFYLLLTDTVPIQPKRVQLIVNQKNKTNLYLWLDNVEYGDDISLTCTLIIAVSIQFSFYKMRSKKTNKNPGLCRVGYLAWILKKSSITFDAECYLHICGKQYSQC